MKTRIGGSVTGYPSHFPTCELWTNSLILLLSSVTLELARRSMAKKEEFAAMGIIPPRMKRDLPWLGITVLLGFCFLAGQVLVWNIPSRRREFFLPRIQAVRCFTSSPAPMPSIWWEDWLRCFMPWRTLAGRQVRITEDRR